MRGREIITTSRNYSSVSTLADGTAVRTIDRRLAGRPEFAGRSGGLPRCGLPLAQVI